MRLAAVAGVARALFVALGLLVGVAPAVAQSQPASITAVESRPAAGASRPAGIREFVADDVRVIVDEHAARLRVDAMIVTEPRGNRAALAGTREEYTEPPRIFRSWQAAMAADRGARALPGIGQLHALAKQFDDDVVCTLQTWLDDGDGAGFIGRREILTRLAAALERRGGTDSAAALAFVQAALHVGDGGDGAGAASQPVAGDTRLSPIARRVVATFMADGPASTITGPYSKTAQLRELFLRMRLLAGVVASNGTWRAPMEGDRAEGEMAAALGRPIVACLEADQPLRAAYDRLTRLDGIILTPRHGEVPSAYESLSAHATSAESRRFLPPRTTRVDDFIASRRLYGAPFLDSLVVAVRTGAFSLDPGATAGWCDRQVFALEPLVRAAAALEAPRVVRGYFYDDLCERAFRSAIVDVRETHAVEMPGGGAGVGRGRRRGVIYLDVRPDLIVDPQFTVLRRMADAWDSLRQDLIAELGADCVAERLLVHDGTVAVGPIADELGAMSRRHRCLVAEATRRLGGPPEWVGAGLDDVAVATLAADADDAVRAITEGPAATTDPRVSVAFSRDIDGVCSCGAIIGVGVADLSVAYDAPPTYAVIRPAIHEGEEQPVVARFLASHYRVAFPISVEYRANRPMDRAELRALCDARTTVAGIQQALDAWGSGPAPKK